MRLVCPACSATYDVPEQKLTGRSSVKCARCGERWSPEGLALAPPAEADEMMQPEAPDEIAAAAPAAQSLVPAATPPAAALLEPVRAAPGGSLMVPEWRPPPSPALPLAWGFSVAAVICGVAFLVIDHAAVAAAWPPIQRLYGLLRLS